MLKPIVILGSGGHSNILAELIIAEGRKIVAVVSPDNIEKSSPLSGIRQIMTDEEVLSTYESAQIELVNGIGTIPSNDTKFRLFNYFSENGYRFASVISPHAILAKSVKLEEGVQIMSGAIIQTNAIIGMNSLINSGAIVEHDCYIGAHNHIAPGATLSGSVTTGSQVHVGTGANIIQNIKIGHKAIVGAGCTVIRDISEEQVVVPARNRILR
nr:acetyltransferase [uncultured Psychrobacter sp.]